MPDSREYVLEERQPLQLVVNDDMGCMSENCRWISIFLSYDLKDL
jgi:hypothetical protein